MYPKLPIFLATDSVKVIDEFQHRFGKNRIFNFANLDSNNEPLHEITRSIDNNYERNSDAIIDLLLLSNAKFLLFEPTLINQASGQIDLFGQSIYMKNKNLKIKKSQYSGFSILAKNLKQNPHILKSLFN